MPAPDPILPEQLARLWALLLEGPDVIRRLLRRPRLAAHPRRLRVPRRAGVVVVRGRGCHH